jgi:hypothetical protein
MRSPHNDQTLKGFHKDAALYVTINPIHNAHRFQHHISGTAAGIHPGTIHGDDDRSGSKM